MKQYLKVAAILGLICAVAAVILASVNAVTAPKIQAYEQHLTQLAMQDVSMGYELGEKKLVPSSSKIAYTIPLYDNGKKVGVIMEFNTTGYGGPMSLLASFDMQGKIMAVKMLSNSETPGLGKKSESKSYMEKFIGTGSSKAIPLTKDDLSAEDAQAVSGATITYSGISKGLASGSEYVKTEGGN